MMVAQSRAGQVVELAGESPSVWRAGVRIAPGCRGYVDHRAEPQREVKRAKQMMNFRMHTVSCHERIAVALHLASRGRGCRQTYVGERD
jgi:hypothetical protein